MNCKKDSVLIVEDELLIADNIQAILENEKINVCGIAMSYDKAIHMIEFYEPSVVLLDIQLKGTKTGIDIGKWILNSVKIPILFLTSQDNADYVNAAFEMTPVAYIIKPVSSANLISAVKLALFQAAKKDETKSVDLKVGHESIRVAIHSISYLKSDHVYIEVHTDSNTYLVRATMEAMLDLLGDSFIQIHRSYAINKLRIDKAATSFVKLTSEDEIPVSRKYRQVLRTMIL